MPKIIDNEIRHRDEYRELVYQILKEWGETHDKNQKLWDELKQVILIGMAFILVTQLVVMIALIIV